MKKRVFDICPTCLQTVELELDSTKAFKNHVIYVHKKCGDYRTYSKESVKIREQREKPTSLDEYEEVYP